MSRITSLVRRLLVLATGEGGARVLGILTFAVLARALGVSGLGVFSFGMSLALILECLMDFGQNAQVGLLVAQDPEEGAASQPLAAGNKIIIGAVLAGLAAAIMSFARFGAAEALVVVLMLVWAAGLSVLDSLRSAARSLDRFRSDSVANASESALRFGGVVALWLAGASSPWMFALVFAAESWLAVAVFWRYLGRGHPGLFRLRQPASARIGFLKQAAPFGVAVAILSIFYNFDQVLVRTIVGAAANGLYGSAARISFTASVLGGLLALVVFPDLARLRKDARSMRSYLAKAAGLAASIGFVTAGILFVVAEPLLVLLYGARFAAAAPFLRVLCLVVAFRGISTVSLYAANAAGRERGALGVAAVFAAVSVGADLLLLPRYGAMAAAWISGVGEVCIALALLAVSLVPWPAPEPERGREGRA
jgi:O-antigen/teichoic acid export membrane protein